MLEKNKIVQIFQSIFALFLVSILGLAVWKIGFFFVSALIAVDPRFSASIIGAMATVTVGVSATIVTQKQIKIREVEEAYRTKKVDIYQGFLDIVTSIVMGVNQDFENEVPSQDQLTNYMVEFKKDILLWGSPEVIKCQLAFESASKQQEDLWIAVDNLYKAIRKDLGLSNKGLNNYELIKMYLQDPEELDRIIKSRK